MGLKASTGYFRKGFTANSTKKAYLKAMKFLFKLYFAKSQSKHIESVSIYEQQSPDSHGGKSDKHTIVIELRCEVDIDEIHQAYCNRCEEVHKLPYLKPANCEICRCNPLLEQAKTKLKIKRSYYRERFKYLKNKMLNNDED